jgi:hypothetical protein
MKTTMKLEVKVYRLAPDGIGRQYRTILRTARDFRRFADRETAWIRVDGRTVKAEVRAYGLDGGGEGACLNPPNPSLTSSSLATR